MKEIEINKYNWEVIYTSEERSIVDNLAEGKIIRCFIEDEWLCLTKYDDEIYAFKDKCPHAGASLFRSECKEEDTDFI